MDNSKTSNLNEYRANRAERRRNEKKPIEKSMQQIAEEFPQLEGETVEQWETRFVQALPAQELKKLFVAQTKELRDTGTRLGILKKELKARGIK